MVSMNRNIPITVLVLLILTTPFLAAETEPLIFGENLPHDAAERGEQLTVKLLTVGQGDPVYLWYGHIALVIEDQARDRNLIFDFGVFDFEQENFYTNFAMGRLYYRAVATYLEPRLRNTEYQQRNSSMLSLNLPPEKRYALYSYLLTHVQPEHAVYLYHHYYDNCSTRIRDIIDYAVDGQLSEWAESITSEFTYREHIRRYSSSNPPIEFLLSFLQSSVIDRPITLWDEFFLPDRLERALIDFSYTDSEGNRRQLVTDRQVLTNYPSRAAIPEEPPVYWPYALGAGLIWAVLGVFLLRGRKIMAGLFITVHGLILGVLGSALLFMMVATDQDVTFGNVNILLANPLHLLLAAIGIMLMIRPERSRALLRIILILEMLITLLLPLALLLSTFTQHNQISAALIAPGNVILGVYSVVMLYKEKRRWNE
jgi:hypothetical protein